jgi:hypothetical protein
LRKITRGADYRALIDANVQAVLNDMFPNNEADKLSRLTNRLAILVAALVMCGNELGRIEASGVSLLRNPGACAQIAPGFVSLKLSSSSPLGTCRSSWPPERFRPFSTDG